MNKEEIIEYLLCKVCEREKRTTGDEINEALVWVEELADKIIKPQQQDESEEFKCMECGEPIDREFTSDSWMCRNINCRSTSVHKR